MQDLVDAPDQPPHLLVEIDRIVNACGVMAAEWTQAFRYPRRVWHRRARDQHRDDRTLVASALSISRRTKSPVSSMRGLPSGPDPAQRGPTIASSASARATAVLILAVKSSAIGMLPISKKTDFLP